MGLCDIAPHDGGAAVWRHVGARPLVEFETPSDKAKGAVRGYGPAPEEGGLLGTACGILVKPEGFFAKPLGYRSSGPSMCAIRRLGFARDVATFPALDIGQES
jgi:hypothetical protein